MPRSKKVTVQFDTDGVLADFTYGFTKLAHEMGFGNPIVNTEAQKTWSEFEGLTKKQVNAVWGEIGRRGWFWYLLPPLLKEATFKRIHNLRKLGAEVYFVTARHTGLRLRDQTELWFKVYGVTNPTVVFTEDKAGFARAVHATHSIEDKFQNAAGIGYEAMEHDLSINSYLIDRPYNRLEGFNGLYTRVATVDSFLDIVEGTINASHVNERPTSDDGTRDDSYSKEAWGVRAA